MKKFSLQLNKKQMIFLSNLLPAGYSLCEMQDASVKIDNSGSRNGQKYGSSLVKNSLQSYSQEQDFSHSSERKNKRKPKLKKSSQKQLSKEKIKMRLQNPNNSSNSSKTLAKVKILTHILDQIQKKKSAQFFIEPVDPIKLQIPHYFDIIKEPMDLLTMRRKAIENKYITFQFFQKDLEKITQNCITFNKGNQFFFQAVQKFFKQYQKILDKNKAKIDEVFTTQKEDTSQKSGIMELNSEEETNSEEEERNKPKKKISNKNQKRNEKKQNLDEKKIKNNENSEQQKVKQKQASKHELLIQKSTEKKSKQLNQKESNSKSDQNTDKLVENKQIEPGNKQKQKRDKDETQTNVSKQKQRKPKKIKKYSYDDRLTIISRIKKLDRATMTELFKAIKFQKGSSLDFKVLEDEKIQSIDGELKKFEIIHEQKVRQIEQRNQKERGKIQQDFEIAEDKDYED